MCGPAWPPTCSNVHTYYEEIILYRPLPRTMDNWDVLPQRQGYTHLEGQHALHMAVGTKSERRDRECHGRHDNVATRAGGKRMWKCNLLLDKSMLYEHCTSVLAHNPLSLRVRTSSPCVRTAMHFETTLPRECVSTLLANK